MDTILNEKTKINIVPNLHFRVVRKGLLKIQLINEMEIAIAKPSNIAVFYKYAVSNKKRHNNSIRNSKKIRLSARILCSLDNAYYNDLYAITEPKIQNKVNDNDSSITIYLCLQCRLEYGDKNGRLSSPIYLPLNFEKVLTVTRDKNDELIENIEYVLPNLYPLIQKNVSIILNYWIHHLLNSNYSLNSIKSIILYYFSAKDGRLHISQNQTVKLYSDYEYEFESIWIENKGILIVEKYNPKTNIGGKLLISSLKYINIEGHINLNGCGYRSYCRDYKKTGGIDTNIFKGLGYGNNCGRYGGHAGYGTAGCIACNCRTSKHVMSDIYGDDKISKLYLGSAGGNGMRVKRVKTIKYGKAGGGALNMRCNNGPIQIIGCISSNSTDSYKGDDKVGYGSGGSIKIECEKLIFDPSHYVWWSMTSYLKSRMSVIGRGYKRIGAGRICIKIKDKYFCGNHILDINSCLRLKFYYIYDVQMVHDKGLNFEKNDWSE